MARIRTIKPEFWTDEKLVQLPYEARLLFIGLWNFADDEGRLWLEPERIRMQIFPNDDVPVDHLIQLLETEGLISIWWFYDDREYIEIKNFLKHQKIDRPTKSKIGSENSRSRSFTSEIRRGVAAKYGIKPGESARIGCYYCREQTDLHWWKRKDGKPTRAAITVGYGFTLDHLVPLDKGGENHPDNIVVACRSCNCRKHTKDFNQMFLVLPEPSRGLDEHSTSPIEDSRGLALERNGKEEERKGVEGGDEPPKPTPIKGGVLVELWQKHSGPLAKINPMALTTFEFTYIRERLEENPDPTYWKALIEKMANNPFFSGDNPMRWKADFVWLITPGNHVKLSMRDYNMPDRNGQTKELNASRLT